ncbi:MAG TPA: class I SAM-dependent methyltransferase, partial [Chloroflexota bacterium]
GKLLDRTWAFSALAAALETGLIKALSSSRSAEEAAASVGIAPDIAKALLDVLASVDLVEHDQGHYVAAPGLIDFVYGAGRESAAAWLCSNYLQSRQMVDDARDGELRPDWGHTDPTILEAQGRSGLALTRMLATKVFPMVPDLEARLRAPGGAFLDIGMGVGVNCIELCRIYPHLRAVGLEPGATQAAEARRSIAEAGLENRIEVRSQHVEDLTDRETYDLAFFPQVFMPVEVLDVGAPKVRDALRPGGWIMLLAFDAPGDNLHSAIARLMNVLWGGGSVTPDDVAATLLSAGFEQVQVGGNSGALLKGVMGRRPL